MKIKICFLLLSTFFIFSCATTRKEDNKLKSKMLGTWSGSEEDNQIQGVTKYWIQIRNKNGTYVLLYTTIENCEVENFVEKGNWWVEDGVFYEKYENSDEPDVYTVKILDDKNIKFKAKKLSAEFENKEYEFTEIRQE